MMPINSTGVKTHRDHFAFDFDRANLIKRIEDFRNLAIPDDQIAATYDIHNTRDWKLHQKREALSQRKDWKDNLTKCLYRPFDIREYYHHEDIVEQSRDEVMRHMLTKNLGFVSARQVTSLEYCHVLCTSAVIEMKTCSHDRATNLFPLYLYPQTELEKKGCAGRRPNLSQEFIRDFSSRLGMEFIPDGKGDRERTFGPEDIFDYMYAVFHSPAYRGRYAEFLKMDFPRLPLTSNADLFRMLCEIGAELVRLHLMEKQTPLISAYPVAGDNSVENVRYTEPGQGTKGRVWINKTQYFEGILPEVWNFHIGGYQVCQKWLKDRKGRKLTYDDLGHYQRVAATLEETIRVMNGIDKVIEKHGGWPVR